MCDERGFLLMDALVLMVICSICVLLLLQCCYALKVWAQVDKEWDNDKIYEIYHQ